LGSFPSLARSAKLGAAASFGESANFHRPQIIHKSGPATNILIQGSQKGENHYDFQREILKVRNFFTFAMASKYGQQLLTILT
jgi:hypothetical protein